jgi:NADH:ubiquinone oxidoreductase subunit F (NADH-binding)
MVHRIEHGQGRPEDMELLNSIAFNIKGRTICALGDAAAMPVEAMIKNFREELNITSSTSTAWCPHTFKPGQVTIKWLKLN